MNVLSAALYLASTRIMTRPSCKIGNHYFRMLHYCIKNKNFSNVKFRMSLLCKMVMRICFRIVQSLDVLLCTFIIFLLRDGRNLRDFNAVIRSWTGLLYEHHSSQSEHITGVIIIHYLYLFETK